MEIHSAAPGEVDPQSSPAESPPQVSVKASKLVVQGQNNLADDDSEGDDVCRICWGPGHEAPLFYPCSCRGTMKYVHEDCLVQWLNHTSGEQCHICKRDFALSQVYATDTRSILSFRDFLQGVYSIVLKTDFETGFINLFLFLKGLGYLWVFWAVESSFTILVTTPVESPFPTALATPAFRAAFAELAFSVSVICTAIAKVRLLETLSPHLRRVGLARPVAFVFARWVFPNFGYSISINSAVNRFLGLGCLGLEVGWCVVRGLLDLHSRIRKDLYLVRRGLLNYSEREKAHEN